MELTVALEAIHRLMPDHQLALAHDAPWHGGTSSGVDDLPLVLGR